MKSILSSSLILVACSLLFQPSATAESPISISGIQSAPEAELILLPEKESYLLELDQNAGDTEQLSPDSYPAGTSVRGETSSTIEWNVSEGLLKPESDSTVRLIPTSENPYLTISVEWSTDSQWTSNQEAIGAESTINSPATSTATLTLLRPLKYDRNGDGTLAGSIIGIYPDELSENAPSPVQRNQSAYTPPSAFYLVTPELASKKISRHATLGDFVHEVLPLSNDPVIALDLDLLKVWDQFIEALKENDLDPEGAKILRGYVSPQDRLRLERMGIELAEFTRFQYGDALAIIYDANNDFRMDDLNGDGAIDSSDSEALAEIIKKARDRANLYGGIGIVSSFEGPNHVGTPYVHLDLRGWNLEWSE